MACQLLNHMRRCFQSSGGVVKPLSIAQRLKSVSRQFQLGRQEDAHEYLRHAIDCMCKSSIAAYERRNPNVKLDAASKETTAFNHIFGGYLRSQVTCIDCKSRSDTFDHFMDLMLDIKVSI
jgi:ubiquitin carboxyl-terminal hydrolase 36/42